MARHERGLYEVLITEALEAQLHELDRRLEALREPLRPAEAADRIALHLARVVERTVKALPDDERVHTGIHLVRQLIQELDSLRDSARAIESGEPAADTDENSGSARGERSDSVRRGRVDVARERPILPGTVLRAIAARLPDGRPEAIPKPLIPLLDTTLLTNAPGEPRVGHQLAAEIESADRIDVVMAFIRRSGIGPLLDGLRRHCEAGRPLRVLTTSYTGTTEAAALDELQRIGADVRVSYDTTGTRLHAKAWLFHRRSGFSTGYIGSSNLTFSAQVSGLEWNVRVSGARNADVLDKVAAVFESYWNSGDFVPYERDGFLARTREERPERTILLPPIELRLEPYQERLLEEIELSRRHGHHRNLLVSATGTGKTVMAAVDYLRLRESLPRARLLFVAHREEILEQSLATFRFGLREPTFGEMWVGGRRPLRFEHVFASIQSLAAADPGNLVRDHFDVVIVDEFHHAAAPTYRALLDRVRPVELLGLTGTPERSDGLDILHWFDDRIAAELRLWDAIDQHRLSPFVYYGIHDGMDLREVPWRRGTGYDAEHLTNVLTANDVWARRVLAQTTWRVGDVRRMRALAFCVSVAHARFMARVFGEAGVAATAVWADSPDEERKRALEDLRSRRLNVVFSVDLFNEGVDVPAVDTLLMLRPTDSPTLFLQQLGRGLRKSPGKTVCTVLDFVGHHRREFRFDRRFRALLGGTRKQVEKQVADGFPFLPAGCHMELDRVAAEIVLRSIRQAVPSRWPEKVAELRSMARDQGAVGLARFLTESGLDLDDVYSGPKSWSDLLSDAGLETMPPGPAENALRKACGRLLHVDDRPRIDRYTAFLSVDRPPAVEELAVRDHRMLRMLVASVCDQALAKEATLQEGAALVWAHPQVRAEIRELLAVLGDRIEHVHAPLDRHPTVPLQVHARYSRLEILAAFGVGHAAKVAPWQTGVYWAREARADLLAFTLDKTSGQFSPTTRYRDYAVSRELIHWESQSATRSDSETGQRYQRHGAQGSSVMLFARLRQDDRAFWFLGPATYVDHESEQPMAITWRLAHPLPGDLFASFAAAVA